MAKLNVGTASVFAVKRHYAVVYFIEFLNACKASKYSLLGCLCARSTILHKVQSFRKQSATKLQKHCVGMYTVSPKYYI